MPCPRDSLDVLAAALSGAGEPVELIETHMSWVLLTPRHALKLKKPVRTAWFDFTGLESRERNARQELALNRRLAPEVYLRLLALRSGPAGFALVEEAHAAADGRTLDWVLQMRRLPAACMLDRLLATGQARTDDIERLGDVLMAFYRAAPRSTLDGDAYLARFSAERVVHAQVLLQPRFALQPAPAVLQAFDAALARLAPPLRERAARGRLVDGHGDLRPEHVCLLDPPVVIDALEFSTALRQVDPFDELAFLGMECALAGGAWVGPQLLARAMRELDDPLPPALLAFYTGARALLRARLCAAHLLDGRPRTPAVWLPRARAYLAVAQHAFDEALSATPAGCA